MGAGTVSSLHRIRGPLLRSSPHLPPDNQRVLHHCAPSPVDSGRSRSEAVMFRFFETRIDFRKKPPEESPPDTLWGFYWHFIRQAKGLFIALFALGFVLA